MLRVLLLCAVLAAAAETPGRERCVTNSDSVLCKVRTLDADGLAISTVPSEANKLSIECSNVLLFESVVRNGYFQRTPSLSELQIARCKLLKVPAASFAGLESLKKLSVRTRNLDWSAAKSLELNIGAFDGLRELSHLDLAFNNIKALPADVFCALDSLQEVNLTNNRLRTVERLGFGASCGSNVRSLDLSNNEIVGLPDQSELRRLKRLQNLYLQHNNVTEVSGEALGGLTSLRVVNVSHNRIQTLPEGMFAGTRELREIHLHHNLLFELARGLFHRLEQLLVLDLSDNMLTSSHIDDGTFLGLIRLVVLNLSHNALTRISGKTFKDLFFLQILDLRNNTIGYVEENAFLPLYNLHTLNLAENRLHSVDERLFNGLFVLTKLTLNNNLLVEIDAKAFKNCSDLKELDLSSNQLVEVPAAVTELPLLKTLDLGENQISTFRNGSFRNLDQLTGLRLIDNQIGNLTADMFWDMPSLQVLNLAKNKIQSIERGTFTRNAQLEAIRLDGNYVSDINGVFSTIASLLWLNLSENHLVWFDYAFLPSNLKWLDLHGNFITHLNNYYKLQREIKVTTLDVSHNRLREISPMTIPNSVELLFINNNLIKHVQLNSFADKKNLTRVDMYANGIVKMDLNSLRLSPVPISRGVPEIYVGGNPFLCDCDMEWLSVINNMTAMRQYPRVVDLENVMCELVHSRRATHVPFASVRPSDFLCSYETHCFARCHCCDFDACDCEMSCPHNCSCYHDPLWNTNVVDCSARRSAEMPHGIPMDATDVYLDGNNFKELQNHAFIGRKNVRILYVNASQVETIQNRTFSGLAALRTLHLGENKLAQLNGYEFDQLANVEELYLQNNLLTYIFNETFVALRSLRVLRLDGNRLYDYSIWSLKTNAHLTSLSIGNNLWSCKCGYLRHFAAFVADGAQKVDDLGDVWCWNNEVAPPQKKQLDLNGTACSDHYAGSSVIHHALDANYLPMMVTTFAGIALTLLALVALFMFRDSLRVWLFSACGVRVFSSSYEDADKLYDAYVCYSPKDEELIVQSLAGELENGDPSYHICLHHRDLSPAASYAQCSSPVIEAAEASRRIVLVLTRNFLETEWSRFEFRQALHEALKGRFYKLVVVEEESAGSRAVCDPDLRPYLKTGVRVKWGRSGFWERLRYEMPESTHRFKAKTIGRRNVNTYTLDSSVPQGNRTVARPSLAVGQAPPEYCSRLPAHPQLVAVYAANGRPLSDHIYSSIDSDYSSMDRSGVSVSGRPLDPRHWPPPPPLIDSSHPRGPGHAYLV